MNASLRPPVGHVPLGMISSYDLGVVLALAEAHVLGVKMDGTVAVVTAHGLACVSEPAAAKRADLVACWKTATADEIPHAAETQRNILREAHDALEPEELGGTVAAGLRQAMSLTWGMMPQEPATLKVVALAQLSKT